MALLADRNTFQRTGETVAHPVAAATKIYAGALVVLNASGLAEPGTTGLGKTAVGRAEAQVDNPGIAGAIQVEVRRGVFKYNNFAADTITRADIGKTCYVVDDETVGKTDATGTRSPAGKVIDIDGNGCWVEIG
ncbi:MAG: hypothetical protein PHT19_11060 [Methylococcus sp.]|nr:hypothetical protein [Methylococcus sp.]